MSENEKETCRKLIAENFDEVSRCAFDITEFRGDASAVLAGEGCHERLARFHTRATPPITKCCPNCGRVMLLREFEYFLTGAEATMRGHQQRVRVKNEGNVCRGCRPKRKPVGKCTTKELHNRVAVGDLHPMLAQAQLAKRDKRVQIMRVKGQTDRWAADRKRMWSPILDEIGAEQRRIMQAKKHLLHPQRTAKIERTREGTEALVEFFTLYYDRLRAMKNRIKLRYIASERTQRWPPRPDGTQAKVLTEREFEDNPPVLGLDLAHWSCFLTPDEWTELVGMWQALPNEVHLRGMRVPPLISRRTGSFGEE